MTSTHSMERNGDNSGQVPWLLLDGDIHRTSVDKWNNLSHCTRARKKTQDIAWVNPNWLTYHDNPWHSCFPNALMLSHSYCRCKLTSIHSQTLQSLHACTKCHQMSPAGKSIQTKSPNFLSPCPSGSSSLLHPRKSRPPQCTFAWCRLTAQIAKTNLSVERQHGCFQK